MGRACKEWRGKEEKMEKQQEKSLHTVAVILFIIYLILLSYLLFFSEDYGRTMEEQSYRYNLHLFQEIKRFWQHRHTLGWKPVCINLFGNIAAFVPFGFFVPMLKRKRCGFFWCTLLSALFSLCVETIQIVFKVGAFDVDDLVLNTIGGMAGYLLFRFIYLKLAGGKGTDCVLSEQRRDEEKDEE